ncbi:IS110 family transposase [Lactococcus lactis]|nr:IS110 family transposase [Lactococcus lactis]WDA67579.1 hypothetical protein IL310_01585 [Lactococcus lactis]
MLFVDSDISKRTHVASVKDDNGKVLLKGFAFPNPTQGTEKLL